jgi:hypothetical protein
VRGLFSLNLPPEFFAPLLPLFTQFLPVGDAGLGLAAHDLIERYKRGDLPIFPGAFLGVLLCPRSHEIGPAVVRCLHAEPLLFVYVLQDSIKLGARATTTPRET